MRKIKLLIFFLSFVLVTYLFSLSGVKTSVEVSGASIYDTAATQSELSSYGITFGTWGQVATSEGVQVNTSSSYSFTNLPAIGIKGSYYVYTYSYWTGRDNVHNMDRYVGTTTLCGFPGLRVSAPTSASGFYWEDTGKLYFRGYYATTETGYPSWKPVYITTTGATTTSTDTTIISKPAATITVSAPSGGGTVSGGGQKLIGGVATITASASQGHSFAGWYTNSAYSGSAVSTSTSYSFKVTATTTYYAKFTVNKYKLTLAVNNSLAGTVSGGGTFDFGTLASINAVANKGYTFSKWSNNDTDSSTYVNVIDNYTYTAIFTANIYSIEYDLGGGTISKNPTTATYDQSIEISNPTRTGYTFAGWTITGYDSSTAQNSTNNSSFTSLVTSGNKYTYFKNLSSTNNAKVRFTAVWNINSYQVNVTSSNTAYGTVTGSGKYNYGTSVTLRAINKVGYAFAGWYTNASYSGQPVSTNNDYSFTMDVNSNLNYYAKFVQDSIHVNSSYQNANNQYNNLNSAIESAISNGYDTIYIDGPIGSYYQNIQTFVNNTRIYINYNTNKELKIIGLDGKNNIIYNNAANAMLVVSSGKIVFENVTIYGTGQSKTYGNRDNALLRVSGGQLLLGSNCKVTNSYNIGSYIHYVADWCPGVIDVYRGTLTIESNALISNNTTTYGGDIFVHGGVVNMTGGTISDSTTMGIYVESGTLNLSGSANVPSIYISKTANFNISNLVNNTYVYADSKMNSGDVFGTTDSNASAQKIITNTESDGTNNFYLQGSLKNTNQLAWNKVTSAIVKTALQLAIENASGKYTITAGEQIALADVLGKYVKHLSGCLSIGSVEITSGNALTQGSGKRTTIIGNEVGTITITLKNVSTYRCYYYGTTKINEVQIQLTVLPKIGDVIPSNTSIAVMNCDADATYIIKDSNGNILSTVTPNKDTTSDSHYVRFEYLTENTDYIIEVEKTVNNQKYTQTQTITTSKENALVSAIKNADGFYMNEGENILLTNIIGKYVYHLRWCINISNVKIVSSDTNVASITGSAKSTVINALNCGYIDLSMNVKTNGWCAVYGNITTNQEVTIRIYVLPNLNIANVVTTDTSITLPQMGSTYQYSIDNGATWISANSAYQMTNLSPNTTYTVILKYNNDDKLQSHYSFKTEASKTVASMEEKKNELLEKINSSSLLVTTQENLIELITNSTSGVNEYNQDVIDLLNQIEEIVETMDSLGLYEEDDIIATQAVDKLTANLKNENLETVKNSINSNDKIVENVKTFIDNISNAVTKEDMESALLQYNSLTALEQDALSEHFEQLKEEYQKAVVKVLEQNSNISDIFVEYKEELESSCNFTKDTILDSINSVNIVLDKANTISTLRGYEDSLLSDASTYFNDSIFQTIDNATENFDDLLVEGYKDIAAKHLEDYALTHSVTITNLEINKITVNNTGFSYDGVNYSTIEEALTKAIYNDKINVLKTEVQNIVSLSLEEIESSGLDVNTSGKLESNLQTIQNEYIEKLSSCEDLSSAEKVLALVKEKDSIEKTKREEIITLNNTITDFSSSYSISNMETETKSILNHFNTICQEITSDILESDTKQEVISVASKINLEIVKLNKVKEYLETVDTQYQGLTDASLKNELQSEVLSFNEKYSYANNQEFTLEQLQTDVNSLLDKIAFNSYKEEKINYYENFLVENQNISPELKSQLETVVNDLISEIRGKTTTSEVDSCIAIANTKLDFVISQNSSIVSFSNYLQLTKNKINKITNISTDDKSYFIAKTDNFYNNYFSQLVNASNEADLDTIIVNFYNELDSIHTEAFNLQTTRGNAAQVATNNFDDFKNELLLLDSSIQLEYTVLGEKLYNDVITKINDGINVDYDLLNNTLKTDLSAILSKATLANSYIELDNNYNTATSSYQFSDYYLNMINDLYYQGKNSTDVTEITRANQSILDLITNINNQKSSLDEINAQYEILLGKIANVTDQDVQDALVTKVNKDITKLKEEFLLGNSLASDVIDNITYWTDICDRYNELITESAKDENILYKDYVCEVAQSEVYYALKEGYPNVKNNQYYLDEFLELNNSIDEAKFNFLTSENALYVAGIALVDDSNTAIQNVIEYKKVLEIFATDAQSYLSNIDISMYTDEATQAIIQNKINDFSDFSNGADVVIEINDELRVVEGKIASLLYETYPGIDAKLEEFKTEISSVDRTLPIYQENTLKLDEFLDTLDNGELLAKVSACNEFIEMKELQDSLSLDVTDTLTMINKLINLNIGNSDLQTWKETLESTTSTVLEINQAIENANIFFTTGIFDNLRLLIEDYPQDYKNISQEYINIALNNSYGKSNDEIYLLVSDVLTSLEADFNDYKDKLLQESVDLSSQAIYDGANLNEYVFSNNDSLVSDYTTNVNTLHSEFVSSFGELTTYQAVDTLYTEYQTTLDSALLNLEKELAKNSFSEYVSDAEVVNDFNEKLALVQNQADISTLYNSSIDTYDFNSEKEELIAGLNEFIENSKDLVDLSSEEQALLNSIESSTDIEEIKTLINDFVTTNETKQLTVDEVTTHLNNIEESLTVKINELQYLSTTEKEQLINKLTYDVTQNSVKDVITQEDLMNDVLNEALELNKNNSLLTTEEKTDIVNQYITDLDNILNTINSENYPNIPEADLENIKTEVSTLVEEFKAIGTDNKVDVINKLYEEVKSSISQIESESLELNNNYQESLNNEKEKVIQEITDLINQYGLEESLFDISNLDSCENLDELNTLKDEITSLVNDVYSLELDKINAVNTLQDLFVSTLNDINQLTSLPTTMKEEYQEKVKNIFDSVNSDISLLVTEGAILDYVAQKSEEITNIYDNGTTEDALSMNEYLESIKNTYANPDEYYSNNFSTFSIDKDTYLQKIKEIFDNCLLEIETSTAENVSSLVQNTQTLLTALTDVASKVTTLITEQNESLVQVRDLLSEKSISDEDKESYSSQIEQMQARVDSLQVIVDLDKYQSEEKYLLDNIDTITNSINTYELNNERTGYLDTLTSLILTTQSEISRNNNLSNESKSLLESELATIMSDLNHSLTNQNIATSEDLQNAYLNLIDTIDFIETKAQAASELNSVYSNNLDDITKVFGTNLESLLNTTIENLLSEEDESKIQTIIDSFYSEFITNVDSSYKDLIDSLTTEGTDVVDSLRKLSSTLDLYSNLNKDVTVTYLADLQEVVETLSDKAIEEHDLDTFNDIKTIVDAYLDIDSSTNIEVYVKELIEENIALDLAEFDSYLDQKDYTNSLIYLENVKLLITDYNNTITMYEFENGEDYTTSLIDILDKYYDEIDLPTELATCEESHILEVIGEIKSLNNLYNDSIIDYSSTIYKDKYLEVIPLSLEDKIKTLTLELIESASDYSTYKDDINLMIKLYLQETNNDPKYNSYPTDELDKLISANELEIIDFINNESINDDITTPHMEIIDLYRSLLDKYNLFSDSSEYLVDLESRLETIIQSNGNEFSQRLINDLVEETALENYYNTYHYANTVYKEMYDDNSFDDLVKETLLQVFKDIVDEISASAKYYEENITNALSIYSEYVDQFASANNSLDFTNTYYSGITELRSIPTALEQSLVGLNNYKLQMISSNSYLENDLVNAQAIIDKFLLDASENPIVYFVDNCYQLGLEQLETILPYSLVSSSDLSLKLEEIYESNSYFEDDYDVIESKYLEVITLLQATEDGSYLSLDEVNELLSNLNNDIEDILPANQKAIKELETLFETYSKDNYSYLNYQEISNIYQNGIDSLSEINNYDEVQELFDSIISNMEVYETLEEQSFTKVKADALDALESMLEISTDVATIAQKYLEEVASILPGTDSKNEVTAILNQATIEILEKCKEEAKEELANYQSGFTSDDYNSESLEDIDSIVNSFSESINSASSINEVFELVNSSKELIAETPTIIEVRKETLKSELEELVNDSFDIDEYFTLIEECESIEDLDLVFVNVKEEIIEIIDNNNLNLQESNLESKITEYINSENDNEKINLQIEIEELLNTYLELDNSLVENIDNYNSYLLEVSRSEQISLIEDSFNSYYEIDYSAYNYKKIVDLKDKAISDINSLVDISEIESVSLEVREKFEEVLTIDEENIDETKNDVIELLNELMSEFENISELVQKAKEDIETIDDVSDIDSYFNEVSVEIYRQATSDLLTQYPALDYTEFGYRQVETIQERTENSLKSENLNYQTAKNIYLEAVEQINGIDTLLDVNERIDSYTEEINKYSLDDSSLEIKQIINDYLEVLASSQTVSSADNTYYEAINALQQQLLSEKISTGIALLESSEVNFDDEYYYTAEQVEIDLIIENGITALQNCKVYEKVDEITAKVLEDSSKVLTKIDYAKEELNSLSDEYSYVNEVVNKWVDLLDTIEKTSSEFTYEGSTTIFTSLDLVLEDILTLSNNEVLNLVNENTVKEVKEQILEYSRYLISTNKFSRNGQISIETITTDGINSLDKIDLTQVDVITIAQAIAQETLSSLSQILADNTYTSDGLINKDTGGDEVDYTPEYDYSTNGFWGNVAISKDSLDLDVALLIQMQKQSAINIVKKTFTDNKDNYQENNIDLAKSEIKLLFDIYLQKGSKRFEGPLDVVYTIKILIPEEYRNTRELCMVHITDDGTLEFYEIVFDGNFIVFETSHFSDYALIGMTHLEQTREEQIEIISDTFLEIDSSIYTHEQWQEIRTIYSETVKLLESQTISAPEMIEYCLESIKSFTEVQNAYQYAIDYSKEVLQNAYDEYDKSDYTKSQYQEISDIYESTLKEIDNKTTVLEIEELLENALMEMSLVNNKAYVVTCVTGSFCVLVLATIMVLYLFFFKVKYVTVTGGEETVVASKRSFYLFKVNPRKVKIEIKGSEVSGIYTDEQLKWKADSFRMPFGRVKLYVATTRQSLTIPKRLYREYIVLGQNFDVSRRRVSRKVVTTNKKTEKTPEKELTKPIEVVTTKENRKTHLIKSVVTIQNISNHFKKGDVVDIKSLKKKKLINENTNYVKILATGYINKPLTVKANSFSGNAIELITTVGGKVVIVE